MNTFNRVVIVVLFLILIPLLSVLFVIPHSVLYNVGGWMRNLGEQLWTSPAWVRLPLGILLALIFDAVAAFIIYLEVRRPHKRFIHVQQRSGGEARLAVDSIVQQLKYKLEPMPNVIKVEPVVKAKGNKVQAEVDVTVAPEGNVPEMAAQLVEGVKDVLTAELGLNVAGEPAVQMTVATAPRGAKKSPDRQAPPPEPVSKQSSAPFASEEHATPELPSAASDAPAESSGTEGQSA
jgi:hypothetical protein